MHDPATIAANGMIAGVTSLTPNLAPGVLNCGRIDSWPSAAMAPLVPPLTPLAPIAPATPARSTPNGLVGELVRAKASM